jgi:SAM-dependent methyltransferase
MAINKDDIAPKQRLMRHGQGLLLERDPLSGIRKAAEWKLPLSERRYHFRPKSDERIREEGFVAVRTAGGKHLARELLPEEAALDCYMMESGQYSAIAQNWVKLKSLVAEIRSAKAILDITCATGRVDLFLISGSDTGPLIYANEVSPDLMRYAKRRFEIFGEMSDPKQGSIHPMSSDISSPGLFDGTDARLSKGMMDVVLWWGSFNMLADRGMIMSNAFDLLKPHGRLVIMDVYPWEPIPYSYVGARGAKLLAFLSRSLDMAEDVKRWVNDQWTKKIFREAGHSAAASFRPEVMELAENLISPLVGNDAKREMRCLCFKKPDTK